MPSREQLYEDLWSEPLGKVAARYRVSNTELKEICYKYKISTPDALYWIAKRHHEQAVREPLPLWAQPLLPAAEVAAPEPTIISVALPPLPLPPPPSPEPEQAEEEDDEIAALIKAEVDLANQIVVHDELRAPHPAVKRTKEAVKDAGPGLYGRVCMSYEYPDVFRLQITRESVNRSFAHLGRIGKGTGETRI